jgi:hypothetical protein
MTAESSTTNIQWAIFERLNTLNITCSHRKNAGLRQTPGYDTATIYTTLFPAEDAAAAYWLNGLRTRTAWDPTRTQKVVRTDDRTASWR